MYKHILISIFCLIALLPLWLRAQDLSNTYSSGMNGTSVLALTNSNRAESIYYLNSANQIASAETTPYLGLPSWKSGILNNPAHAYVGYRSTVPDTRVNPIYLPNSTSTPNHSRFTLLENDPQGDSAVPETFLDILQTKITFSETKLYYSIKNNSNEFPVVSGLTFYSYMGFFVDPNADPASNPPVFGLMYTLTASGVIAPGLYKITGTATSDLELIGEITHSIDAANGTLTLSCNLSDLLANPDFSSWYNPQYPLLLTSAITSKISLVSGNTTADSTPGAKLLLKPQLLSGNSSQPTLSNPVCSWANGSLNLMVIYSDSDANAPVSLTAAVDSGSPVPLLPLSLNGFEQPVSFAAQGINCPQDWSTVTIRISYGGEPLLFTFNNPVSNQDLIQPVPVFSVYPNPVRDRLFLRLDSKEPVRELRIFNLRGQIQPLLLDSEGRIDTSGLAPGPYFIRLKTVNGFLTRSFVKQNRD